MEEEIHLKTASESQRHVFPNAQDGWSSAPGPTPPLSSKLLPRGKWQHSSELGSVRQQRRGHSLTELEALEENQGCMCQDWAGSSDHGT